MRKICSDPQVGFHFCDAGLVMHCPAVFHLAFVRRALFFGVILKSPLGFIWLRSGRFPSSLVETSRPKMKLLSLQRERVSPVNADALSLSSYCSGVQFG